MSEPYAEVLGELAEGHGLSSGALLDDGVPALCDLPLRLARELAGEQHRRKPSQLHIARKGSDFLGRYG